jgi:5-methylcytosine-specific restriction enzyme A
MDFAHTDPKRWYGSERWRRRAKLQVKLEPLCRECAKRGLAVPAQEADHDPPHGNDVNRFLVGPLRSLCSDCHRRARFPQRHGYERDIGLDGFPLDPNHPCYRGG